MAYAVGQVVEVCLDFDLPLAQGVRFVVATFENERGDVAELTDVPAGVSECFLQKPTQTALQGRVSRPGLYELKRLRVERSEEHTSELQSRQYLVCRLLLDKNK